MKVKLSVIAVGLILASTASVAGLLEQDSASKAIAPKGFEGLSVVAQDRACAEILAGLSAAGRSLAKTDGDKTKMNASAALAIGSGVMSQASKEANSFELASARQLTLEVASHLSDRTLDVVEFCSARVTAALGGVAPTQEVAEKAMKAFAVTLDELSTTPLKTPAN